MFCQQLVRVLSQRVRLDDLDHRFLGLAVLNQLEGFFQGFVVGFELGGLACLEVLEVEVDGLVK